MVKEIKYKTGILEIIIILLGIILFIYSPYSDNKTLLSTFIVIYGLIVHFVFKLLIIKLPKVGWTYGG